MTESELLEIYHLVLESIDGNFQFWLSTTIAMIVAAYYAGKKMSYSLACFLIGIYLIASWLFIIKLFTAGGLLHSIIEQTQLLNKDLQIMTLERNLQIAWLYGSVFLFGTLGSIIYILNQVRIGKKSDYVA